MAEARLRPTRAEIDLEAWRHNVALLAEVSRPAALCAVIKADGYGHGAALVASAALDAGAAGLAVAVVDEGIALREAGVAGPILVLSEPPADAAEAAIEHHLTVALYSPAALDALDDAAARVGTGAIVHVKVDTGMHRVGLEPDAVAGFLDALATKPRLTLEGFWTHLAVADGQGTEDREFTAHQLDAFEGHLSALTARGFTPSVRHAANSAGAIAHPRSRYDLVRAGIALYGELPHPSMAAVFADASPGGQLRPVLSLRSEVVALRHLEAGARPSYGRLRPLPAAAGVATVPLGYADGVPRRLFEAGGEVLIGGRRRAIAGAVTMDQLVVDCGPDGDVAVGDEVVLIGRQGAEAISAAEWARLLGTISYEVLTGIGPRVPRVARGRPAVAAPAARTGWRQWLRAATGPSAAR